MEKYKVIKKQGNSNDCIVCGLKSDASLKAAFYELENQVVVAVTEGKDWHQSYPGRMHGGVIAALLDETMGRALLIPFPDKWAVTANMNIKYRKIVPLNTKIRCFGKIDKLRGRILTASGYVEDEEGNLLAEASATYVIVPLSGITEGGEAEEFGWRIVNSENDPLEIEMGHPEFFTREVNK